MMKIYLKIINPIIALIVFLLCIWAGLHDMDGKLTPELFFLGAINIYFLAKGIFCGTALFLLGLIAGRLLGYDDSKE